MYNTRLLLFHTRTKFLASISLVSHIRYLLFTVKEYSVTVYTGIEALAGTDADVFMKLVGKKGQSRTVLLDKARKDDFERNRYCKH